MFPTDSFYSGIVLHNVCEKWPIHCSRTSNEDHYLVKICYCPQTKFTKVMFSQVSVCPQGGVCHTPTAWVDIPWVDTPLGRHPSGQTPPGRHPPGWHHLVNKRAVLIPLVCILVYNKLTLLPRIISTSVWWNQLTLFKRCIKWFERTFC